MHVIHVHVYTVNRENNTKVKDCDNQNCFKLCLKVEFLWALKVSSRENTCGENSHSKVLVLVFGISHLNK